MQEIRIIHVSHDQQAMDEFMQIVATSVYKNPGIWICTLLFLILLVFLFARYRK